jgi:putative heme iron utilization protein
MSKETVEATRTLLRSERFGVLCTVQASRKPGWPLPSLAPYALTARGEPVFALSALAQHTKNLLAEPRASLYVQARTGGDPQEAARIAVLGRVRAASPEEQGELRTAYLVAHPEAERFFALDFALYVLSVEEVRYIGGFGAAAWVAGAEVVVS